MSEVRDMDDEDDFDYHCEMCLGAFNERDIEFDGDKVPLCRDYADSCRRDLAPTG